eukprot:m.10722 g.10722  ORF g.10722 m.10722 type:complete len:569 (+) comp22588_c0_seq1:3-1709(+)
MTFLALFLVLLFPCQNAEAIHDYMTRVSEVYSRLSLPWPFGLESGKRYESLIETLSTLNRNATAHDHLWLKHATVRDGKIYFLATNVANGDQSFVAEEDHVAHKTPMESFLFQTTDSYSQFPNGSDAAELLLSLCNETKCQRNDDNTCKKGTVETDPKVAKILQLQRALSLDEPLNQVQFLGTHNSYNNHADGYGNGDFLLNRLLQLISFDQWDLVWAQQWFTMTDQLNMGARHLMLDPVYFLDEMRLCHCGTSVPIVDKILDYIEKILNMTLHFDSRDLGCLPHDRAFSSGVAEICDWLQAEGNEEEIVIVNINDEGPSADWGHQDLIQAPVASLCSKLLFTPSNKSSLFPQRWPSSRELLTLGRRLIFHGPRIDNENIFPQLTIPEWDHDTVKYFTPFPKCGGYPADDWYLVGGESQVVGPIYNGPKEEGLVTPANLPYLLQCGVSVTQMDLISPGLVSYATWSWNETLPSNGTCAAVNTLDSYHWAALDCSQILSYACRPKANSTEWTISPKKGMYEEGDAVCSQMNLTFAAPIDGYSNTLLQAALAEEPAVGKALWIGHTTAID